MQTIIFPRGWTWHTYRQGSVELVWGVGYFRATEKTYFATDRNPSKIFLLRKTLKNAAIKHNSFSENEARYDNNQELC